MIGSYSKQDPLILSYISVSVKVKVERATQEPLDTNYPSAQHIFLSEGTI